MSSIQRILLPPTQCVGSRCERDSARVCTSSMTTWATACAVELLCVCVCVYVCVGGWVCVCVCVRACVCVCVRERKTTRKTERERELREFMWLQIAKSTQFLYACTKCTLSLSLFSSLSLSHTHILPQTCFTDCPRNVVYRLGLFWHINMNRLEHYICICICTDICICICIDICMYV